MTVSASCIASWKGESGYPSATCSPVRDHSLGLERVETAPRLFNTHEKLILMAMAQRFVAECGCCVSKRGDPLR